MQWPSWAIFWRRQDAVDTADQYGNASPMGGCNTTGKLGDWNKNLNAKDWSQYTSPQTITMSIITTAATLGFIRVWKTYLRRIPTADYLKPGFFRRRSLYGYVTRVGDGDNFHLFHTPGGRLMGWGWFPGRRKKDMFARAKKGKTLHVRIAGIDAPEMAHFGRPEQPFAKEALEWLREFVLNNYVRAYPYRQDQYNRVVCSVVKRRWVFFKSDVGLNMLKRGLATVYEAKFGSEFGNREEEYRAAEGAAKSKGTGMWQQPGLVARMLGKKNEMESPREYKTRMAEQEKTEKKSNMAK